MSAVVDFPVKPETRPYLETFGRARHEGDPEWLAGYRNRGLARFAELGFPSRRSEAWRYLDLHRLEQRPMLPVGRELVRHHIRRARSARGNWLGRTGT